jgi:hypothetical protein
MKFQVLKFLSLSLFAVAVLVVLIASGAAQSPKKNLVEVPPSDPIEIPRIWDDEEMRALELPLANNDYTPSFVPADFYYRMSELRIYKSYPIYAPGKEPPGYIEWLKQQEPEIAFDPEKLKTKEDWIKAGELVFNAPIFYNSLNQLSDVRDPSWYERSKMPVSKDGVMPYNVYVIRNKGTIEIGEFSCATCHTRVMPDGSVIRGAQGNYPLGRLDEMDVRKHVGQPDEKQFKERARGAFVLGYYTPWVKPDELDQYDKLSLNQFADFMGALPPGVQARPGVSLWYPVVVPDLIGLKDRRYLDRTGLQLHRSIADLMRYASLNQGANFLSNYNGFIPRGTLTSPKAIRPRYGDAALYAVALYIYSLKPPPNPNKFDALAAQGQKIFEREGCTACHTPPLYTNNRLTPVEGFKVPEEHWKKYDVMRISVGTDPGLALNSRRATGYYKVPSLKGVWYRGPFTHNGAVLTLEDWFNPHRLDDDYVPTGFRGYENKPHPVRGHLFGLDLPDSDRKALIAFLKTL